MTKLKRYSCMYVAVLGLGLAGCDDGGGDDDGGSGMTAGASTGTVDPTNADETSGDTVDPSAGESTGGGGDGPSFTAEVEQIISESCAVGTACHLTVYPPILGEGEAYDNIVGEPALLSTLAYVEPGAPDQSYLYLKITGGPGIEGTPMPPPGNAEGIEPLTDDQIAAIEAWIAGGAQP